MSAEESRLAENEAATSEGLAEHSTCDESIAVEKASQQAERHPEPAVITSPQKKLSTAVSPLQRAVLSDRPVERYSAMTLDAIVADVAERALDAWRGDDFGFAAPSDKDAELLRLTNVAIAKHNEGSKGEPSKPRLRPLKALPGVQAAPMTDDANAELRAKLLGYAVEHEDGQVALAYYFAAAALGRCMFVPGLGWHVYDGARWRRDEDGGDVKAIMLDALRETARTSVPELWKLKTASAIRGALEVAESIEGIRVFHAELDADPWVLNCMNGTLSLKTFDLRPHDPADRLTKVTNAPFDPDAAAPTWEGFLARSLPDPEVRAFVQRFSGMGLVGVQLLHALLVHHGLGRNGKGVFYAARGHVLGDYYYHAPSDLFEVTRGGGGANAAKPAFLALRGCRSVTISETAKDMRVDTALLKALTGGDKITTRALYETVQVSFTPAYSMEMITNYMPQLPADDMAVWARILAVPWDVVIPEAERDPMLGEKLEAEAAGILAWMVAGLREYNARGLDAPDAVKAKTDSYQEDQDDFKRFLEECCEGAPTKADELTVSKLRKAYTDWAASELIARSKILNSKEFSAALEKHGHVITKAMQGMVCGLRLAVFEDANDEPATPAHEPRTPAQKRQSEEGKARAAAMLRATGGAEVTSGAPRQKAADAKPLADVPEEAFEPVG